jgi:uncharacterized membrane protein required for colicin V production
MWLDVVAFLALAGLATLGLVRGTLATGLRIVALVGAYAAAVIGSTAFAPFAAAQLNVPEVLGMAAAGSATFIVAYAVLGVASSLITRWEKRRRRGAPRSAGDRTGGALFGAAQGAIVVILLGWLGLWLQAGQSGGALESLPDTRGARVAVLTQTVVEKGAEAVLEENANGARAAIRAVVRPTETIENVTALAQGPRMRTLQQDRLFWSYVEHGAIDAALNRGSFLGAAYDSTFRQQLFELGLINQAAAADARLFRNRARDVLEQVSPRIQGLRQDPELAGLMQDPEIAQAVAANDTMALLANPKFRRMLRRVMDGPAPAESAETGPAADAAPGSAPEPVPAAPQEAPQE